jgi:hypothetical protein
MNVSLAEWLVTLGTVFGRDKSKIKLKHLYKQMSNDVTRKMLDTMRKNSAKKEIEHPLVNENTDCKNFLDEARYLMERAKKKINEDVNDGASSNYEINTNDSFFRQVLEQMQNQIKTTIGQNINYDKNPLKYDRETDTLTIVGSIPALSLSFMFKNNDSTGDGCYIYGEYIQLSEANLKIIGKIRACYLNWYNGLVKDNDIVDKIRKESSTDE